MSLHHLPPDLLFKGIALFTPGGDLVYCIDPEKQGRWHLQLCAVLQEVLKLSEPPHFLVPCYAATVDRWRDSVTQQIRVAAEAGPFVLRHRALLNVIFNLETVPWICPPSLRHTCHPLVMSHFREQFPQLWVNNNLVIRADRTTVSFDPQRDSPHRLLGTRPELAREPRGYVLRLFISGRGAATEQILKRLHETLERSLKEPYTLKVIDIYKNPEQAEADQVSATPTLVKVWPPPVRKVVGELHKTDTLLGALMASDPPDDDAFNA